MNQKALDAYFNSFLHKENFQNDISLNGLQVENDGADITRIAFAVDACEATIKKAHELQCGMLFVHHGLFWGHEQTITGTHYNRISALIKNNIALYASHAPLDLNEFVGNNYGLAARLGLLNTIPFGKWKGMSSGVFGELEEEKTLDEILKLLFPDGEKPLVILPFGKQKILKIAVISGGGSKDINQAIQKGADLFITGNFEHEQYHTALENKISVIAGGHYQTETVGIQLVAKKIKEEKGIETFFIDVPTGF